MDDFDRLDRIRRLLAGLPTEWAHSTDREDARAAGTMNEIRRLAAADDRSATPRRFSTGDAWLAFFAGAALGVGLGMLFAPKSGSELRSQLSEQSGDLAERVSEGWAGRGREAFDETAMDRSTDKVVGGSISTRIEVGIGQTAPGSQGGEAAQGTHGSGPGVDE